MNIDTINIINAGYRKNKLQVRNLDHFEPMLA